MNGIEGIAATLTGGTTAVDNTTAAAAGSSDTAFFTALTRGMERVEADSNRAAAARSALAADPSVSTQDVILAMEQAKLSLQLAAEVRQRVVDAYKELTGMQI